MTDILLVCILIVSIRILLIIYERTGERNRKLLRAIGALIRAATFLLDLVPVKPNKKAP